MSAKKDVDMTAEAEKLVSQDSEPKVIFSSRFTMSYPVSVTEQIHHASISEQIRSGQGNMLDSELSKAYYDFPDGKDDGSAAIGVFDMSEPADVFEKEARFKADLSRDLSQQVRAKKASETSQKPSESSDSIGAGETANDTKTTQ